MNITLHKGDVEFVLSTHSIHFIKARTFGDVTFGTVLVTPTATIEVDEPMTTVLDLIKMTRAIKYTVDLRNDNGNLSGTLGIFDTLEQADLMIGALKQAQPDDDLSTYELGIALKQ